jgi:hypothetical protein
VGRLELLKLLFRVENQIVVLILYLFVDKQQVDVFLVRLKELVFPGASLHRLFISGNTADSKTLAKDVLIIDDFEKLCETAPQLQVEFRVAFV